MTWLVLLSLALADPGTPAVQAAPADEPAAAVGASEAPVASGPSATPLTPQERAAMENMDLLIELELLQDFDVVRYLDVLQIEEE